MALGDIKQRKYKEELEPDKVPVVAVQLVQPALKQ